MGNTELIPQSQRLRQHAMQSDHDVTAAMMPNSDMNRIVAKGEDIMSS